MNTTEEKTIKAKLTEGDISQLLIKLSIPMMLGLISISLMNIIDTYFVGHLGTKDLAAISFTFPVVSLMGSLYFGLGNGVASVIARAIGNGDKYHVQRLTTDSIILAVIIMTIFMVIGLCTIDPLFKTLGATSDLLPLIRSYMSIWYLGMVFLVIPLIGNNALRAAGNTVFPSIIMFLACIINSALDPIFIFGLFGFPRLELQGAALATVLARISTFIVSIYLLHNKEDMLTFKIPKHHEIFKSWKDILHIGLPSVLTNIINPISIAIITAMVAYFGVNAIASFGVVSRVEMFIVMILASLSSVIGPFVGQNWSSKKFDRVYEALHKSFVFCIFWGCISTIVLFFFGGWISGIFNKDPDVVRISSMYFSILPLSYGGLGLIMVSNSTLNAIGMPFKSSLVTITRTILLYLPLAYLGKEYLGLSGIFLAAALANILTGLMFYYWNKNTCLHCSLENKNCEN